MFKLKIIRYLKIIVYFAVIRKDRYFDVGE